ncbi:hemolysin family protein [Flaviflexus equikiangi]|uniref:HlyC/CorC family transporter n=1 Tax=Flaviflexus equikiangi TaxID=2758573 RepID=A0ABS2TDC9_9ACTO|nr:hemolysin family protein [Flaviflexus equikiangi]MBM9432646.1 HlyC/CorC family transporter [Flaviflexus equikiangi]
MTPFLTLLIGVIVIALIIAVNGYFVAQEFAYMSVDRARLASRAEAGDAKAAKALRVTSRTSFMLSGAQLGITVTGLLVGYVAEPLVGQSLGALMGGIGVEPAVSIAVGTVLALAVSTIVQMIFGELYPKNLAIANPEPLAKAMAPSTLLYLTLFGWLISFFDHAANALLRLFRIEPLEDVDQSATSRDLERIVDESRATGDLSPDLSLILDRILDFPGRNVEHAMVPRNTVDVVGPSTTAAEVRRMMAGAHTRYPVVDRERPIGVVHLIDILPLPLDSAVTAGDIMRDVTVLPALMSLPSALEKLRESGEELACVVDEHGSFDGIVTLEDLAEEIAGELTDEHDDELSESIEHAGSGWEISGDAHLDEVERAIGYRLPRGDYETVSGLLIATLDDLPDVGQVVRIDLDPSGQDFLEPDPPTRCLEFTVNSLEWHVPSATTVVLREGGDAR